MTSQDKVDTYEKVRDVFVSLLHEVRELSKKKPEIVMSESKVKLINRVLQDVIVVIQDEPQAAYVELLDDDQLPQNSDALLMMVQFDAALDAFKDAHFDYTAYSWSVSPSA